MFKPLFDLKFKRKRDPDLLANDSFVLASYTIERNYVQSYVLAGIPSETRKVVPLGYVMALDPTNQKIVPHYTTYGFKVVGVLFEDGDAENADPVVDIIWRGDVLEKNCWDNGGFGSVLEASKTALTDRIQFVSESGIVKF